MFLHVKSSKIPIYQCHITLQTWPLCRALDGDTGRGGFQLSEYVPLRFNKGAKECIPLNNVWMEYNDSLCCPSFLPQMIGGLGTPGLDTEKVSVRHCDLQQSKWAESRPQVSKVITYTIILILNLYTNIDLTLWIRRRPPRGSGCHRKECPPQRRRCSDLLDTYGY